MNRTEPQAAPSFTQDAFVTWVRQATPYIHAHRGRTFVIAFGGEALLDSRFPDLVHDIALLHGLGIHLVLVHGARPQIEQRLREQGAELRYVNGLRVTDERALACVKEAAGIVRVEIEALLSLGLANSPMAGVRIPVVSGNFVTARPLGVIDGVDYAHTGLVRRVDQHSLKALLDQGMVVLMPPLGYSPTGEVFNLSAADVARSAAAALGADKLIFLLEGRAVLEGSGLPSNLLTQDIDRLLQSAKLSDELASYLRAGAEACRQGVKRVHLVERCIAGALMRELLTHRGSGTLISAEPYERLRSARIEDIPGILDLLRPLEEHGILIRRTREHVETDVAHFHVLDCDGLVIACAALYPYPAEGMAELACLAVHPDYRGAGRGERLLAYLSELARDQGLRRLFVLTTQTAQWFQERGFTSAGIEALPNDKRALYNTRRNSKVFVKDLCSSPQMP
ncbi:amino-acid N-acetyltransferase [Caldichromatium japonicum]|uniref:Amino-acid acetyltransferase n=1 Tax=Caldichromatium japonicum TaxID=2699430 RepID=A0A6G7VCX8_9GAMM|nr:amino-acid N-acetyltransferase [Caldichromatium japonicum]QIK37735.1 amino-acid N-acetyltransferase [Caldichromatium japonicum]